MPRARAAATIDTPSASAGQEGNSANRAADMLNARSLADFMGDVDQNDEVPTGNEEAVDAGYETSGLMGDEPEEPEADDEDAANAAEENAVLGDDGKPAVTGVAPAPTAAQTATEAIDPEELRILRDRAKLGEAWETRYGQNPVETLAALLDNLQPWQQEAVAKLTGIAPAAQAAPAPTVDMSDWTDQEKWVETDGKKLPDRIAQLEALPERIGREFDSRDTLYGDAVVEAHVLRHQVRGLAAMVRAMNPNLPEMPAFDPKDIGREIASGKTLRAAVDGLYEETVNDTVERFKQAIAQRPPTTQDRGTRTNVTANENKGKSLFQILESLGG